MVKSSQEYGRHGIGYGEPCDSSVGEYSAGRRGPSVFLSQAVVFYLFRGTVLSGEGIQCGEEPEMGARL